MGLSCWCGSTDFSEFGAGYLRCLACGSLVCGASNDEESAPDELLQDFYGKEYWFSYQEHFGQVPLVGRARSDLPERCVHWLRDLLKHRLPPGRCLEIGCGHGGFVATLRWAGFDATGIEVSSWVVDFARETFGVPVLLGPLEEHEFEEGSLDVVFMFDVLEHLPDPQSTLAQCLRLLKDDGILVIQTPQLPSDVDFVELQRRRNRFLEQLKPREHRFLFSEASVRELLARVGAAHVSFEPAIFAHYDMYLVASRRPIETRSPEEAAVALEASPHGRLVRALLDSHSPSGEADYPDLQRALEECERDRQQRLEVIEQQGEEVAALQKQVHHWIEENNRAWAQVAQLQAEIEQGGEQAQGAIQQLEELRQQFDASEADRAARLVVIERQGRELGEIDGHRNRLLGELEELKGHMENVQRDRADRLKVIEDQGRQIGQLRGERDAYGAELEGAESLFESLLDEEGKKLAAAEAELEEARAAIEQLRRENSDESSSCQQLESKLSAQAGELRRTQQELETQLRQREAERTERGELLEALQALERRLQVAEKERAAASDEVRTLRHSLDQSQLTQRTLRERLSSQEALADARSNELQTVMGQLRIHQWIVDNIRRGRVYRNLRRLGRWGWVEEKLDELPILASLEGHSDARSSSVSGSGSHDAWEPEDDRYSEAVTAAAPEAHVPSARAASPVASAREAEAARAFSAAFEQLRDPKRKGAVVPAPGAEDRLERKLVELGVEVRPLKIDVADYHRFVSKADYYRRYPKYYDFNIAEKTLEHYLAAVLLELKPDDRYIDVASEHSPVPEIYGRVFGVEAYRQDLSFPPGLHGRTIGGSAAALPVPDAFANKMALHCSLEHFEGNADVDFVRETARVLRPGGATCIVPLYLAEEYGVQTDPLVAIKEAVPFEADAIIFGAQGWANRHGRFYDPEHLVERIQRADSNLDLTVFRIMNAGEVAPSCYVRFAAVLTRSPGPSGESSRAGTDS